MDCDEIRGDLGAYALGALEPDETQRVAAHLENCASCRHELEQLSFASELLRTPLARTLATESEEAQPADRGLSGIAAARARERRRLRQGAAAAAAGGAALLAALGIAVSLATRPVDSFAPSGAAATLRPATGIAATASVRLSPRPWGTQVDLVTTRMPPLPAGAYYELWLVRADGSRVAAGSFRPTTADGRARVRLAAALPLARVARIGVTREGPTGSARILSGIRA